MSPSDGGGGGGGGRRRRRRRRRRRGSSSIRTYPIDLDGTIGDKTIEGVVRIHNFVPATNHHPHHHYHHHHYRGGGLSYSLLMPLVMVWGRVGEEGIF